MNIKEEMDFYGGKLTIDDSNINRELAEYSSYYFRVLQITNSCEENFDKTESLADTNIRKGAAENSEKITEKVVEARVNLDEAYQEASSLRNQARALKEAYKSKGNMLIQIATNMREEMKNLGHSVSDSGATYAQYV